MAFSQPPSRSTGSIGAATGTVSMCAQKSSVRSPLPGTRASRLPQSPPMASPAPSSLTSRPRPRSSEATASAQARSLPEGLSIRHSDGEGVVQQAALRLACGRHELTADRCSRERTSAAATNSRNSGAGRSGRDLNSGWNCEAT